MKKILAAFLTLSLICLLISCNTDKNPNDTTVSLPWYNTITFETSGGSYIHPQTTSSLNSPPTTTRNGYLFNGWYLDAGLTTAAIFPLSIDNDMTIYAKWLKISDVQKCADASIKLSTKHNSSVYWYITPTGFDLDELSLREYYLEITITYEVYYKKDYDVPFDIGYFGSPKYEAYILNSDNRGTIKENLSTNKEADKRTLTYKINAVDLKNQSITLKFSTDNVQNIIYFENININYQFKK